MEKMVRYSPPDGSEIPPDVIERLKEAAKHPIVFTKDCPELTDEQLAEFVPANFATWEERRQAMIEMGIFKEEKEPVLA